MHKTSVTVTALMILIAAGCGQDKKKTAEKTAAAGTATNSQGQGMPFHAFELGPYLAAAAPAAKSRQMSLEYGYFDVRQEKNGDREDIFDYRLKQIAAIAADGQLPAAATTGCSVVKAAAFATATAKTLKTTGAVATTLTFAQSGFARLEDRDGKTPFALAQPLTAEFDDASGAAVASVTAPDLPTPGAIQLAGAFDANVTVNTVLKDLNTGLASATTELLVTDVGSAKNYDLVVVTFYGGGNAKTPMLRCILPPDGSASIAPAQYKDLLPLKGITGHFAKVAVTTSGDVTVWTAAVAGQGAEDLLVP